MNSRAEKVEKAEANVNNGRITKKCPRATPCLRSITIRWEGLMMRNEKSFGAHYGGSFQIVSDSPDRKSIVSSEIYIVLRHSVLKKL